MTRIEKAVKEVSELRDFYFKIKKRNISGPSEYSQKQERKGPFPVAVEKEPGRAQESD